MSLWVDKYRPTNLNKLHYHQEQAASLKRLVEISIIITKVFVAFARSSLMISLICLFMARQVLERRQEWFVYFVSCMGPEWRNCVLNIWSLW